tara:strand:- start:429 stop:530 length:102 start_codon:yes stop_codon:yes gene_type:complete
MIDIEKKNLKRQAKTQGEDTQQAKMNPDRQFTQ